MSSVNTCLPLSFKVHVRMWYRLCCCSCVSRQGKELRGRCPYHVFCPEEPIQTDPAPRRRGAGLLLLFLLLSGPQCVTLHLCWCLLPLSAWRLWSDQAEDRVSDGALHESGPAAFPVWYSPASVGGRGERVATEHQEEFVWHGHGGGGAPNQHHQETPQGRDDIIRTVMEWGNRFSDFWSCEYGEWFYFWYWFYKCIDCDSDLCLQRNIQETDSNKIKHKHWFKHQMHNFISSFQWFQFTKWSHTVWKLNYKIYS